MQLSRVSAFLLFLAAQSCRALSDKDKTTLVDLHNNYRAKVTPPAANMLKMSWDPTLEKLAKSFAAECIWGHNPNRGARGENLYITSAQTVNVQNAMDLWYGEQKDYDFSTLACKEGKMCGHYTQVVWATSYKVGCGEHFCENVKNMAKPRQTLLVCNYEPPGNFQAKRPYIEGSPCSKCPDQYKCFSSLCAIEEAPPLKPDPSEGWSTTPHSTSTLAYTVELEEASAASTTATQRATPGQQPSSPKLRTSPEGDLDLEDSSVASVTTQGFPHPQQISTHSLTSVPGLDRDVQEPTITSFTPTDPMLSPEPPSFNGHLISTQVDEEKEDRTTLRNTKQTPLERWPSSQSFIAKDIDRALEDASESSKAEQNNLPSTFPPNVRIITSPKGDVGLTENYQSAITPESMLSPETPSLLPIITAASSHVLPFHSDPAVNENDASAGATMGRFPGLFYVCLLSAIFVLELGF